MSAVFWILQPIIISCLSPLIVGIIRKIKSKFQNLQGASIFQPYRDLIKLFHKDEVISEDASWIFKLTPYIVFSVTVVASLLVPFLNTPELLPGIHDFLVLIYILAIGTFFLALAGMDTGSAFGGTGSSREMTVSALAEGAVIFSILPLVMISQSTNLIDITHRISAIDSFSFAGLIIAFIAFIIALLAETGRYPFDNPSTHLELTMIHEAMILEYSGKKLALMEWASANKLMIFMVLGLNLFFPLEIADHFSLMGVMLPFIFLMLKILIMCFFIAAIESKTAKYRFFRLPGLLFTAMTLGIIAILITI